MEKKHKKTGKRLFLSALVVFCLLAILPLSLITVHFNTPSIYGETYYGAFLPLSRALKAKQGKKVVVIGTSSVAFGIDSKLLSRELGYAGLDYGAIGYGLYGALGSKIMMETALPYLGEGDILILSPELYSQTLSEYFSPIETYRAIEKDTSILSCLSPLEKSSLALALPSFMAEKISFLNKGEKPKPSGVYAAESFDEEGDMRYGLATVNTMDGYWGKTLLEIDPALFSKEYIDYLNTFSLQAKGKGASVYYRFCPVSSLALSNDYQKKMADLHDFLREKLEFPLLGNPTETIYEPNYFFDSDFHLNDAGRMLHTLRLVEDIKTVLGNTKPLRNLYPEPPDLPKREKEEVSGDDSDASSFLYEVSQGKATISGMSEEGKTKETLILPTHVGEIPVIGIASDALTKAVSLRSLRVQRNIDYLPDSLFAGLSSFSSLHLNEGDPSLIHVGWGLLEGSGNVTIYVPKGSLSRFRLDYFWSHYSMNFVEEEK